MSGNHTRFDGLAEHYRRWRPGFPPAAFEAIIAAAPERGPKLAVDVGAGTGLSTAGLLAAAPNDWRVAAAEPGADMRAALLRRFAAEPRVRVLDGAAEATGLPDGAASVLLAARAMHWFDLDGFFAEARRVLAPDGVLVGLYNHIAATPATTAINAWFDSHGAQEGKRVSHEFDTFAAMSRAQGFTAPERIDIDWSAQFDAESLAGLYLTRATLRAVVERLGETRVRAALDGVIAQYLGPNATCSLDYTARLVISRRA